MTATILPWIIFGVVVAAALAVDLGIFHRRAHEVGIRESLLLSLFWIGLALLFNAGIYLWHGRSAALDFFTGYLIEKSLSVDNIFVFLLMFSYFGVPQIYRHKVLFWGIIGAVVMRVVFITAGITLIQKFHWIIYAFGVFLIITGAKMAFQKDKEIHPERNPVLRIFRRFMPITADFEGGHFLIRKNARLLATPLLVALLTIETTDVVFAVDSVPAILAITIDPFIVVTSNIFAILGLRALYFAVAGIVQLFCYFHYGLSAILVFIGIKMLIADFYKMPTPIALGVVAGVLAISIVASLIWPEKEDVSK